MIPKLIWQTHEAPADDLKAFEKNAANTWNFLNATWTHKYVDGEQRALDIQDYDPELTEIYLRLSKTTQSDLWRYVKLYQEGGVYADMDSVCVKPLDDFMDEFYAGQEMVCTGIGENVGENQVNCANFAAVKNSKILKDILDSIKSQYQVLMVEDTIDELFQNQSLPWNTFCETVMANQDDVLFGFNCESHSSELKIEFSDYDVYYNGQTYRYLNLAKLQDWDVYIGL